MGDRGQSTQLPPPPATDQRGVLRLFDDAKAITVDAGAFAAINFLQLRHPGGPVDAAAIRAEFARWQGASLTDYYAPPDGASLELGDGACEVASPICSGVPANDRVRLDVRLGPDGWRSPTMFLLHALMSVSNRGYLRWAERLNERGWTGIFVHLPYHYDRCPPKLPSGAMAVTSNLVRSADGLRQAVIELRLAMRALEAAGCPRVGVWGQSYGALVGALLALLEPRLDQAWLLEPIVDVEQALWTSPACIVMRRQLRAAGITRAEVGEHLRLVCPSHHRPAMDANRVLLVAGLFDRIAPAPVIQAVHERWPGSHYAVFRQGHIGYTLMPRSWDLVNELGWLDDGGGAASDPS